MEPIKTASRIHPLMATAAVSVILVSLVGTAAITGMIPSSKALPAPSAVPPSAMVAGSAAAAPAMQPMIGQQQFQPALAQAQFQPVAAPPAAIQYQPPGATAPVTYVPAVAKADPAPKAAPRPKAKPVTKVVYRDRYVPAPERSYAVAPAPAPAPVAKQPNYVAMGLGAVVGGLAGNQIGDGNGRKAATVAGVIGGAMLGNHIANRQQQQ